MNEKPSEWQKLLKSALPALDHVCRGLDRKRGWLGRSAMAGNEPGERNERIES